MLTAIASSPTTVTATGRCGRKAPVVDGSGTVTTRFEPSPAARGSAAWVTRAFCQPVGEDPSMEGGTRRDDRRLRRVLAAASLAMFVVQLDYFALNLALPQMADDFGESTADLQWVISGNMLALAALLIFGGRVGDIFGRRKALLVG